MSRTITQPRTAPASPTTTSWSATLLTDSPADVLFVQPITVGLPFPRGMLAWPTALTLTGAGGRPVMVQAEPLARWADGTVRWLLVDWLADDLRAGSNAWLLAAAPGEGESSAEGDCAVRDLDEGFQIGTGAVVFRLGTGQVLPEVLLGGRPMLAPDGTFLVLTDAKGRTRQPRVETIQCESAGPVRSTICVEGTFAGAAPCRFVARLDAFAGTGLLRVRLTLHNPRRARHRGGLWDLGDVGSILFRDLSLELALAVPSGVRTDWRAEADGPHGYDDGGPVEIYQDSSGGKNWKSRNHVNRRGTVPCSFRGYRVRAGGRKYEGLRADPVLVMRGPAAAVAVAVPEFWQQFPKAIEVDKATLRVRLFPKQFGDLHELQGGEQKTHTVWLNFGPPNSGSNELDWVRQPAVAHATPEWYAASGAFAHLTPADLGHSSRLDGYLKPVLEGETSLFAGREVIDEFGWRNFGEVYADHEAAYYTGPSPLISHYNNQYDMVYGAILQFCRTGDRRWWEVADPLARHVADIDIYHTTEDKAAYNGGLFWFTDHHKDAATSTHRTYSRSNREAGKPYGGGPGTCHNFAAGLAHHYYLTGDPISRAAALSLADWVIAMDDGSRNILGLVDDGPTGLASSTSGDTYHGPGRGPGLSINALLDGWQLTGRRAYLNKVDELIRRAAHPTDDVEDRDLLNAELRWSYTIFLAALDRYLSVKAESHELDEKYAYARACLLHYSAWMVEHEVPYFDRREQLEFPTEAWPAQEFRKANVLRLASAHADQPLRDQLLSRGRELADRAWSDLLSFPSRHVARAVALVMTEGARDDWFRRHVPAVAPWPAADEAFDAPEPFVPQKRRVLALLRSPVGATRAAGRLLRTLATRPFRKPPGAAT